mgnify:FL=1
MMRQKKCGCGRSPTVSCVGWHSLTDEEYLAAKMAYEKKNELRKERLKGI